MAISRFSHLGLCVSDLEGSLRFYGEGLGFREESRLRMKGAEVERLLGLEGVELVAVYLVRDGTRLELLHYPARELCAGETPRPLDQPGLTHLSLRVDRLDATLSDLEALGGSVLEQTRIDRPEHRTAAVFVLDPDGTRIELLEAPGDPGRALGSSAGTPRAEPGSSPRP
jgi:catechol 2,3-dioxygenase-like lactoylglutathione lyase family enzyme